MNAKDFQDLLKESKDILQEGYFDPNEEPGYFEKARKKLGDASREQLSGFHNKSSEEDHTNDDEEYAYSKRRRSYQKEESSIMDKVIEKIADLKDAFENPEDLYDEVISILANAKDSVRDYMQSMEPNLNSVDPDVAEIIRAQRAKRKQP